MFFNNSTYQLCIFIVMTTAFVGTGDCTFKVTLQYLGNLVVTIPHLTLLLHYLDSHNLNIIVREKQLKILTVTSSWWS